MKIMVIGYARHGKDSVAEILAKLYGLKHTSSSMWAAEKLMLPAFKQAKEDGKRVPSYSTVEECFADRGDHRAFWFDVISAYCKKDGARLIKEIFADHDIYVGCRNARELYRALNSGVVDYTVWVERLGTPPEPVNSNNLQPWMANTIIHNDGTLEDLEAQIKQLFDNLFNS